MSDGPTGAPTPNKCESCAGKSSAEAHATGEHLARMHFHNRFRREHPEFGKQSAS